jgi:multiple sugar transport system substrate-binding protein
VYIVENFNALARIRKSYVVLLPLVFLWGGCARNEHATDSANRSAGTVALRLLIIDDPAMAEAIRTLRGEWRGQTGSTLTVVEGTISKVLDNETLDADAAIVPSAALAALAERASIAPVPADVLEEPSAAWSDVFSLLRAHEAVWDGRTVAIPFGSPVLTCYYRPDLLARLNRRPPQTWKEYQELARLLADRATLGDAAASPNGSRWRGTMEPLAEGWGALVLLARAAAYVTHREHYSALFDLDTMRPLIDGPPFVRALEELVAVAGDDRADLLSADPGAVRRAFWNGQCGMALTWPTAVAEIEPVEPAPPVGFVELPGSPDVFQYTAKQWEKRREGEEDRVTLLGAAGRWGVVSRNSEHSGRAFQLLTWLAGHQGGRQVCAKSDATTLFRQSHVQSAADWVEKPLPPEAAAQYATETQRALGRQQRLFAIRLPGHADYLAALDEAVHAAVRGEQSPEAALRQASARWEEITERLGRDAQGDAYLRSLGL